MATETFSSSNNGQATTLSDKPTLRSLQCQKSELRRLATFRSCKEDIHPTLSKGLLAKAGFSYTESENKLKCDACGFEIESWTSDIDLIKEHMKQSLQCQFVLDRSDLVSDNGMLLIFLVN
jgi:hypothetical protein